MLTSTKSKVAPFAVIPDAAALASAIVDTVLGSFETRRTLPDFGA